MKKANSEIIILRKFSLMLAMALTANFVTPGISAPIWSNTARSGGNATTMSTPRVTVDRPIIAMGYISVRIAFAFASCSASRISASCSSAVPRPPVISPTSTTVTYSLLNTFGCLARAWERLPPSSRVVLIDITTRFMPRLLLSEASISKVVTRLAPLNTIVASCLENLTSSPVLTLTSDGMRSSNEGGCHPVFT